MKSPKAIPVSTEGEFVHSHANHARSVAALLGVLVLSNSLADTPSIAIPTDVQSGLEEIIVTAQRRSTNLERTPVAISVLSGDTLQKQDITTETDLRTNVPGLGVRSTANSNQLNYVIRGQSLDAFSNNRPGVLPYVDEVQVGGAGTASAFYDLQSVQVLKGPQGTLFGRNASGGAVVFTTQKPADDVSGYVTARGGNYGTEQYEGAVNVPVVADKVLARLAGFYQKRDGYQYDVDTQSRTGNLDRYGFRPSLTINFTDTIHNTLVVDYAHYNGGSSAAVLYALDGKIGPIPSTGLYAGGAVSDAYFSGLAGANLTGAWAAYVAAHPHANPNGIASVLSTQQASGPFLIDADGPNTNTANNVITSNISTIDIATDMQIKNIVGYTHLNSQTDYDADGTPYDIDANYYLSHTHQLSDELQLLGKAIDNQLNYVGGAFFSNESTLVNDKSTLLALPPIIPATLQNNDYLAQNKTFAGYFQGTYDLSAMTGIHGLGITAGARYQSERISSTLQPQDSTYDHVLANPATESTFQKKTFDNLGWTVGAQEQLTDSTMVYIVSRRAHRNGGFNGTLEPVVGPGSAGGNGYLTEIDTDAEFGVKYQGIVATMPTRINLAAYNMWIVDGQHVAYTLNGLGEPAPISVNVPRSLVSGVELDAQITPVDWLKLGLAYNYTDARFTNNDVSILGRPPIVFGTYPDTPRTSGSVFTDVTIPVSSAMAVTLHGDLYDQSRIAYSSTANINPTAFLSGYAVADFRMSIDAKSGWTLAANVKNAFNRVYYAGGIAVAELFQFNSAIPGDPRTFTVEASYRF